MREGEAALFLECVKIATKVAEIHLLVTGDAFSTDRVSNLVLYCIHDLSFARTVYNTVQQSGRGREYDNFLNDLDWNDFLMSLAMMSLMGMSQKGSGK